MPRRSNISRQGPWSPRLAAWPSAAAAAAVNPARSHFRARVKARSVKPWATSWAHMVRPLIMSQARKKPTTAAGHERMWIASDVETISEMYIAAVTLPKIL